MFVIDNENDHVLKINEFIQNVSLYLQSLSTTIEKAENISTASKHIGENPRDTTLFVIFFNSEEKSLNVRLPKPIEFLAKLSNKNASPKCFIVHRHTKNEVTSQP